MILIRPRAAAAQIAATVQSHPWRSRYIASAARNLARWNTLATSDRDAVINLIAALARRHGSRPAYHDDNIVAR